MELLKKILRKCKGTQMNNIINEQKSFNINTNIKETKNINIGEYSYLDESYGKIYLLCYKDTDTINIGKFCSIASDVHIFGGGEHNTKLISTFPFKVKIQKLEIDPVLATKGETNIGNDVWIGMSAIILSGVTVGDGVVIGAGSVVTKNIPPYAVVAGNPAAIIKYRFTQTQIEKLLKICWWNWPLERIMANIDDFYDEPDRFIEKYYGECL